MVGLATHERFANFYTDFAFKKLFGTEANKECLIGFLNSLFEGEEEILDLTYLNTEHLGHLSVERKAVFDVYCETSKGEKILIEMQKAQQEFFKDRSIFYSTFPIQEQAPKGVWNFELNKVYTIGLLNFTFDNSDDDYMHHEVKLFDTKTHRVFYDKLTYVYLELPKFRKTEDQLVTLMDKWLYAIKNLNSLMERPKALQEKVFMRFFEAAEIANFSSNEMFDYRESQKELWDLYSITTTAEKKGHAEGRAEGLAEGHAEGLAEGRAEGLAEGETIGILKTARKMKSRGFSVADIVETTGLSEDEIDRL